MCCIALFLAVGRLHPDIGSSGAPLSLLQGMLDFQATYFLRYRIEPRTTMLGPLVKQRAGLQLVGQGPDGTRERIILPSMEMKPSDAEALEKLVRERTRLTLPGRRRA